MDNKEMQDLLISHINNISNAHTIKNIFTEKSNNEDDAIYTANFEYSTAKNNAKYVHPDHHDASFIVTDPKRRFISDYDLNTLKYKVSKDELESSINNNFKNTKMYINSRLDAILNSKNSAAGLKILSTMLKEDTASKDLINAFGTKADSEELEKHVAGDNHLSNEDKMLLEQLAELLKNGHVDWNASEGEVTYIANKPESLPANGGNADTLDGYTKEELLNNKRVYNTIIGSSIYGFNLDDVDLVCHGINDADAIQFGVDTMPDIGGVIFIREGIYTIKKIINVIRELNIDGEIIICGSGKSTILDFNENSLLLLDNNITLKDITIKNCIGVDIGSFCNVQNVQFINSTIKLHNSNITVIKECVFKNCTFDYEGKCFNTVIRNNISISTKWGYYIGGNNIIKDTLTV